jgi:hypothetical protein
MTISTNFNRNGEWILLQPVQSISERVLLRKFVIIQTLTAAAAGLLARYSAREGVRLRQSTVIEGYLPSLSPLLRLPLLLLGAVAVSCAAAAVFGDVLL